MNLLEPKEITIEVDGGSKVFILHKFPAVLGREIIIKYPTANAPKIGDYETSEEVMLKVMQYVAVPRAQGDKLPLSNRDLINNHVPNAETLIRLEAAMMQYNYSFFGNGKALNFLEGLLEKLPVLISKTLTLLSEPSSDQEKRPSKN